MRAQFPLSEQAISHEGRAQHRPMHLRYLKAVKFLALVPAQGLISLDILLSNLQVADVETSSVVAQSSGEEATADKSAQVITLVSSAFPRSI